MRKHRKTITLETAKRKLDIYIKRYYCDVREDVFKYGKFRRELFGYVVSLSHNIAVTHGWQGHNWRQGLRRNLLSYALNRIEKIEKSNRVKSGIIRIFTLGFVKTRRRIHSKRH